MANLLNPILAMACAGGVYKGILAGKASNVATSGTGAAPSTTAADYTNPAAVALAVAQALDTALGQGFDTTLASNANPGVTVGLTGAAAGAASLSLIIKQNLMSDVAFAFFFQRPSGDTTSADWAGIAAAIKAAYTQAIATIYTPNAS